MTGAAAGRQGRAVALAAFFVSGAAGLIYEVAWIRRASLVFGSTQEALSTVLAVFFLGLALGSEVFGRVSATARRPLRVYGLLELALAALALATLALFPLAEAAYGGAYRALGDAPAALGAARVGLVALVLLPPAFLMGGTLPLFARQFVADRAGLMGSVGWLYGLNTLGAAVGCLAAGLLLLPALGVTGTIALGAALNLAAGGAALALRLEPATGAAGAEPAAPPPRREPAAGRGARRRPVPGDPAPARAEEPAARGVALAAVVFLVGATALGYEVLWTRYLALLVRNTVLTYSVTLALVLAGIVAGSFAAARLLDRPGARATLLGALQVAGGLVALATFLLPPAFWSGLRDPLAVYAVLLLPPAALSGASFPIAVRLAAADPALAGAVTGRIAMINTLGGIVGALLAGFVVLPGLGIQAAMAAFTGASVAAGILAWTLLAPRRGRVARAAAAAAAAAAWAAIPPLAGTRVPQDFLAERARLEAHREGRLSHLAVVRREGVRFLEIDRLWQGQDRPTHQIMAAHLPMLLHPGARRVLVVGAGSGQTPSRFLLHGLERLDVVDIEPAVFELIRERFDGAWMDDPRVRLIREDGRSHVAHAAERYDLISLEVGQIYRPGVPSFYTLEFYRQARERLRPGGMVSQFVPIGFLPPEALGSVVATFVDVFPRATLWYNTSELLLVGGHGETPRIGAAALARLTADPRLREDLAYRHWGGADRALRHPSVLLGAFLCGPQALAELGRGAARLGDDRPVIEYLSTGAAVAESHELACLERIRPLLEPASVVADVPADTLRAAREVQGRNLGQIEAVVHLRDVDRARNPAEGRAALARALAANPENAKAQRIAGDLLAAEGRLEEAAGHYRRAVELRPEDGLSRFGYAVALTRLERNAEAVPHYRAAIEAGVESAEARDGLGVALARLGDLDGAARAFQEALRIAPDFHGARERLRQVRAMADSTRS